MKLTLHRLALPLEHPFTIARGSTSVQRSLVVEIQQDGVSGFGESTENLYYGHSLQSMSESIDQVTPWLSNQTFQTAQATVYGDTETDSDTPEELWRELSVMLSGDRFALSAIDQAIHDLHGKLSQRTTSECLGLIWNDVIASSYTIGIDSIESMVAKLNEKPQWPLYKIKLGTNRDVEIVRELRRHTDAKFRVDANCGWNADEAIANSHELKKLGVEFIEQPLPADAPAAHQQRVFQKSALPIIADESCEVEADVAKCAGRFHGINVKLCKCGGITPAIRMLRDAKSLLMKTMVGCMCESSIGISAAAQLLPLLDYVDLDGAVLLATDPAIGVSVINGQIRRSTHLGNGAVLDNATAVALQA